MIKLDDENYNRKIKLTESINNKIINEVAWDERLSREGDAEIHRERFKDPNSVNIGFIQPPKSGKKYGYTYTYAEDFKTGEKIISFCIKFFSDWGFKIGAHEQVVDVLTLYNDRNEYGELYKNEKFLSNGIFTAQLKQKIDKNPGIVNFSVSINSIKIDIPEFKDFDYLEDNFVVYIDSNILRAKNVDEKEQKTLLESFEETLNEIITPNWKIVKNIKTNAQIDAEG